jgi:hypothetical protein
MALLEYRVQDSELNHLPKREEHKMRADGTIAVLISVSALSCSHSSMGHRPFPNRSKVGGVLRASSKTGRRPKNYGILGNT